MTRDELLARLHSIEWSDMEFKEAAWAAPKDSLETVSAFANTTGGHLVFGVKQTNGAFTITGVTDADKVQADFLGWVRDTNKISVLLPIDGKVHALAEGTVLAFYVPEARRSEKPAFLDRNPRKAYIRRGGRDDTCTSDELLRFIRDASDTRYDNEPLPDFSVDSCFEEATVRWYRQRHTERNPGRYEQLSDTDFLRQMACIVAKQHQLIPTRAGILVFGTDAAVRQILSRPVVDFRVYREPKSAYSAEVRWVDRMTPVAEENLLKTWQSMVGFYTRHSEHPFAVDPGKLHRADDPPDYISFREAAINLLIHQDFGEQTRWPTILLFRDQSEFFNPGDAFAPREQLLDPGEKPVRNPSIVALFRRIGLSDQAGSGVGAIYASSRQLGNLPPVIDNDKAEKSFRLTLPKERLLTEAQLLAQASLGVRLSEHEADVFAYVTHRGQVDLTDVRALTGLSGGDARQVVKRLIVQALVVGEGETGNLFSLAEHLRPRFQLADQAHENQQVADGGAVADSSAQAAEQATAQAGSGQPQLVQWLVQLSAIQWQIVGYADAPRSATELLNHVGLRQRAFFKRQHLEPLLAGGILQMTVPDKPTSPNQRYVLTETGVKLKVMHEQQQVAGRTEPTTENP